ncbi:hypothetical protein SSBR45G_73000 [Bradyrhizobium sp. SSBR45G]|nr:hypothetical protein SSBR45G_73000 [Bradyrhizobium sp. SSBR45G]GLH89847.1 hypothetical protein SSBR45R_73080 [Bradyrhizobium sp. SSBR45R]
MEGSRWLLGALPKAIDPFAFAAIKRAFDWPAWRRLIQMQQRPCKSKVIVWPKQRHQCARLFVRNRRFNLR